MNKKYWLTGGITFAVITLVLYFGISHFHTVGGIVKPDSSTLSLFFPPVLTLCLNIVELLPIGYFVSLILGYISFTAFPLPAILIPLISAFLNGAFWGWVYGKMKNRNRIGATMK